MTRLPFDRKQLGQLRPANTTAASLYSPVDGVAAEIFIIVVCNTTTANHTYRIFHDKDGTTYDESTALAYNKTVIANDMATLTFGDKDRGGLWMIGSDSGNLAVRSSSANALNFTVYGEEHKE